MSTLSLRPYQIEDLDAVHSALSGVEHPRRGGTGVVTRLAVPIATGLGKTVEFSALIAWWVATHPDQRVLVLVHRDELAQQARDKIHSFAPHIRPGIVMGARYKDYEAQVIVGSAPTLAKPKRREQIHRVGLIIVDECHHYAALTFRGVLEYFGAFQGVPTIGYTATLSRGDGLGLGEIFTEALKPRDTLWGIRHGYLADVRGIRVQVPQLDITAAMVGGSGTNEAAGTALINADAGPCIAKAILEYAPERQGGPVFMPNVASAMDTHEVLNDYKLPTELILGSTPTYERGQIYRRFQEGTTRWLANAMVLTEGWDAPWADSAVIARPTKSAPLYQQMVGRVLRPWQAGGKHDALVLDMVGASTEHKLASLVDLSPDAPPKPGQSLLEAWEDADDDADPWIIDDDDLHTRSYGGKIVGTEVDLFGDRASVWLQTYRGTWFIPAGDRLFFLWPDVDGTYTVGSTSTKLAEVATVHVNGTTLELGMAWAEKYAGDHDPSISSRHSSWRGRGTMTQAQGHQFQVHQIPPYGVDPGLSKAQASDRISIAKASRRLDV